MSVLYLTAAVLALLLIVYLLAALLAPERFS